MKGFTRGRFFYEDFLYSWDACRERDVDLLSSNTFTFKKYCNDLGLEHRSFDEILAELMGEDSCHGVFFDCFDISHRIFAKQNSITKNGDTLSYAPDFDVTGLVIGTPRNDREEKHYEYLRQACELMCDQIKETLPKLPMCKKHLQVLYLANFFGDYCNTLKEINKVPYIGKATSSEVA